MGWLRGRAEPHNTIDTPRLSGDSGDTQRPPAPPPPGGGPSSGVADGQPRAHSVLLSKGRGGRGGGGGEEGERGGGEGRDGTMMGQVYLCVSNTCQPFSSGGRSLHMSDAVPFSGANA